MHDMPPKSMASEGTLGNLEIRKNKISMVNLLLLRTSYIYKLGSIPKIHF